MCGGVVGVVGGGVCGVCVVCVVCVCVWCVCVCESMIKCNEHKRGVPLATHHHFYIFVYIAQVCSFVASKMLYLPTL